MEKVLGGLCFKSYNHGKCILYTVVICDKIHIVYVYRFDNNTMITLNAYSDMIFVGIILIGAIFCGIIKSGLASRWADDKSLVEKAVKADITSNNNEDPFKKRAFKLKNHEVSANGVEDKMDRSEMDLESKGYSNVGDEEDEDEDEEFHPVPKNQLSKETQRLFPVETSDRLAETGKESQSKGLAKGKGGSDKMEKSEKYEKYERSKKSEKSEKSTFLPSRWADAPAKTTRVHTEQLLTPPPSSEAHRRAGGTNHRKRDTKYSREHVSPERQQKASKDTDNSHKSSWGGNGTTLADMIRNSVPQKEKSKNVKSRNDRKHENEQKEDKRDGHRTFGGHDADRKFGKRHSRAELDRRANSHKEKGGLSSRNHSKRNNGRRVSFEDDLPREQRRHSKRGSQNTDGAFFRAPSKQTHQKKPEKKMSQEQMNEEFNALKEEFGAKTNWADDDFQI